MRRHGKLILPNTWHGHDRDEWRLLLRCVSSPHPFHRNTRRELGRESVGVRTQASPGVQRSPLPRPSLQIPHPAHSLAQSGLSLMLTWMCRFQTDCRSCVGGRSGLCSSPQSKKATSRTDRAPSMASQVFCSSSMGTHRLRAVLPQTSYFTSLCLHSDTISRQLGTPWWEINTACTEPLNILSNYQCKIILQWSVNINYSRISKHVLEVGMIIKNILFVLTCFHTRNVFGSDFAPLYVKYFVNIHPPR